MINPNDRVVVVGNGGSIFEIVNKVGPLIIMHKSCVSIITKIQGYEKHVGTRRGYGLFAIATNQRSAKNINKCIFTLGNGTKRGANVGT